VSARPALRRLVRRPGLATAVVVILALGIGISTAVFSVARRVLWRAIPVAELDRLAVAWETEPSDAHSLIEVSYPYFLEWRAGSRSFEDLAAFGSVNWSHEFRGAPRRETVPAAAVSASFFDTLRASPLLGRTFLPRDDEPGAERVLVLSYALWQGRFAGDPAVVGRTVAGSGQPSTIVGVMPQDFDFPYGAQVWTLLAHELEPMRRSMAPQAYRGFGVLYVVGRLKAGTSLESARTDLARLSQRASLTDQFSAGGWSAELVPLLDHHLGASTRRALEALAVASGLVLLLACANAAVLLLVQAIGRRTDLAVRQAIGASAARAARPELIESIVLALAGGLAGALLARGVVQATRVFGPAELPGLRHVSLDGGALGFASFITVGVAALAALVSAAVASRLALLPTLNTARGGGGADRRSWGLSRLLVAAEVALSIVLLVGCGLMVRSLGKLLQIELGFVPDRALSFAVDLVPEKYPSLVERRAFYRTLIERLAGSPGVVAAGAVHNRPLEYGPIGSGSFVIIEGQSLDRVSVTANSPSVNWEAATPDYFRAMGTGLVEGRTFTEHDAADAPKVVIVSESLARRCWPGQSAIGKRLNTWGAKAELRDGAFVVEWQEVVGVVENVRFRGVQNPQLDVYVPYGQAPDVLHHFVVRTDRDPLALAAKVREEVRALDPDAEVGSVTTMASLVDRALLPWRFTSSLLAVFALAALVLTASGLFAVLHHFVSGRTREIAIRMAVGAEPGRVLAFVASQGLKVTALGLALGLALALVLARSLSALLYEVGERDPGSYLGGTALVGLVALGASLLPALRATRVDPVEALRSE